MDSEKGAHGDLTFLLLNVRASLMVASLYSTLKFRRKAVAMRAAQGRRRMQREPVVHSLPSPVKHPPGSPMRLAGDDEDKDAG